MLMRIVILISRPSTELIYSRTSNSNPRFEPCIFGSSKHIAIVAAVSLLLAASVQEKVSPGTERKLYLNLIFTASIVTGIFRSVLGFLRLGFVVDFLTHLTIVGIMSWAAIIRCPQQLKGLFRLTGFATKTDAISFLHAVLKNRDEVFTGHFSEASLLGRGGYGRAYHGVLSSEEEVAVKRLDVGSGQGESEFLNEVEKISQVHHRHVVSLVGYCTEGSERILVYEYVPNGSLESHLHGDGRATLDWAARLKAAVGSAKGLSYLHEDCHPKILHRDIKAANILLNSEYEGKIADFGLAKFISRSNPRASRLVGTIGYFAPESILSGEQTEKSDIFSFGVVLLQLITGRRPVGSTDHSVNDVLVNSTRPYLTKALEDGNFDSLADRRLQNNYNPSEMARMVACAAACVRESAQCRPKMSVIARVLERHQSAADLDDGIGAGPSNLHLDSVVL